MSKQKTPVSAKETRNNPITKKIDIKDITNRSKNVKSKGRKRYRKPNFEHGDSTTSCDENATFFPKSKEKFDYATDSQILKLKLQEIELMRAKIETLEEAIKSEKYEKVKTRKCFSFCDCLKRKAQKHSHPIINSSHEILFKNQKFATFSRSNPKLKQERHPNITNNNTIVLPENFTPSHLNKASEEVLKDIINTLDQQSVEIQHIKVSLKECIKLLKQNQKNDLNTADIFENYLKLNNSMGDYNQFFPFKQEELYRLIIDDQCGGNCSVIDCPSKDTKTKTSKSVSPKESRVRFTDTKSSRSSCCSKSTRKKRRNSRRLDIDCKNSVTMKVSPLSLRNMPKEIHMSLSQKSLSMVNLPIIPKDSSTCLQICKSESNEVFKKRRHYRSSQSLFRAKRKAKNCQIIVIRWFRYVFCRGKNN